MIRSLPALLIGVIVAGYWGRVARMAFKARRRSGRAANFIPREKTGRWLRVIWVPVVLIWIVQPFVAAFAPHPPPPLRPLWKSAIVSWAAAVAAAGARAATRVCWKRMGRSWRMGIDPHESTPLICTGPYAYVRHPIYALSQLMMIATAAALPSPLMMAAALLHVGLLQWESRREESHLLRVHPGEYAAYRARVGRFLPISAQPFRPSDS